MFKIISIVTALLSVNTAFAESPALLKSVKSVAECHAATDVCVMVRPRNPSHFPATEIAIKQSGIIYSVPQERTVNVTLGLGAASYDLSAQNVNTLSHYGVSKVAAEVVRVGSHSIHNCVTSSGAPLVAKQATFIINDDLSCTVVPGIVY